MKRLLTAFLLMVLTASAAWGAASYPATVKSFTTKTAGQVIQASHINDLQDEVAAVESGLLNGIDHTLRPLTNLTRDLGTSSFRWRDIYGKQINLDPGTLTTDAQQIQSAVVWNAGGVTFTHIKASVTCTACAAASKVMELLVGGGTKFEVRQDGQVSIAGNIRAFTDNSFDVGLSTDRWRDIYVGTSVRIGTTVGDAGQVRLPNLGSVVWRNAANTGNVTLSVTATDKMQFTGDIIPSVDNTADLGGATRWRDLYLGSSLRVGTTPATAGDVRGPHGFTGYARNSANSANRRVFSYGEIATDEMVFGDGATSTRIRTGLGTPGTLSNGDWWVDCTGTSPTRNCSIKVQELGGTRTIATSANF